MTRQISPEGRMSDFHPLVGVIWRSRNEEPPEEVFDRLPKWMQVEPPNVDNAIDLRRVMPQVFETLSEREQKFLWYRFWADLTLEGIGKILGVTRERVRQIEAKVLRKFMHPSRSDLLRPFIDLCPVHERRIRDAHKSAKEFRKKYMEEMEQKYQAVEDALNEKEKRRAIRVALDAEFEIWLENKGSQ
jgi:uncharacterized protein YeaO (DUF488 family)